MKHLLWLSLAILLLSFVSTVSAAKPTEWIESVGAGVYERCAGYDLVITKPYLSLANNTSINLIRWPYTEKTATKLIEALSSGEPYDNYLMGCENQDAGVITRKQDGCGILVCANNTMDINWDKYYWNGEEIILRDRPTNQTNETIGNNTTTLPSEINNKQNPLVWLVVIIVIIIGAVVYFATRPKTKVSRSPPKLAVKKSRKH
jgi:hypothetical protein